MQLTKITFKVGLLLISFNSIFVFPQITIKDGIAYRDYKSVTETSGRLNKQSASENDQSNGSIIPPIFIENFPINTTDGDFGADQNNSCSALSQNGYYAVVWSDERNSRYDIYAQFYDASGNKIGPNVKVNNYELSNYSTPYIAVNNSGNYVIAWGESYTGINAQRFDKNGNKVGGILYVNNNNGNYITAPSISISNDDYFMIMWGQSYQGYYQVFARAFDSFGNQIGDENIVNNPGNTLTSIGGGKFISVDQDGNYIICWSSGGGTSISNIYLQVIDKFGYKIGNNLLVSTPNNDANCYFPEISTTPDGYSLITWYKRIISQIKSGVSARIYNIDQSFVTSEISISEPDIWGDFFTTATENDTSFIIIASSSTPPYYQRINKSGLFIGDTTGVTYNPHQAKYINALSLTNKFGNNLFISATATNRNDENIYLQKFDNSFTPVEGFNIVNDDKFTSKQRYPEVKFNKQGGSIVIWMDNKNGREDLYAQVYDENYNAVSGNIKITDTEGDNFYLKYKKITTLSDGSFIILFEGSADYSANQVWLQKVTQDGQKSGNNVLVKDMLYNYTYKLETNVNCDDEILVCWYYEYGAYARRYNKNLIPLSDEKLFFKYTNTFSYSPLEISIDTSLTMFAAWKKRDINTGETQKIIYGSFLDKNGNPIKPSIIIDSLADGYTYMSCSNNGMDFALYYFSNYSYKLIRNYTSENNLRYTTNFPNNSYSNAYTKIIQFTNKKLFLTYLSYTNIKGVFINDNKRESYDYDIHNLDFFNYGYYEYQLPFSSDLYEDKLFTVFETSQNPGTSIDIWGNVKTVDLINFNEEYFYPKTNKDILYNNFPNPFNSTTKIVYELLAFHKVKLAVYDILGKEVAVLVDSDQEKGIYELNFDSGSLASGVYFLRLDAFDTSIRKIMVLK